MADRHPRNELLHAVRVCWPQKKAVRMFREEFAEQLQGSFEMLSTFVNGHALKSFKGPLPEVAVSLAVGFLSEQAKMDEQSGQDETAGFADFVDAIAAHHGMRDVMLTAGCVMKDDACNAKLLNIIDQDVRPRLISKWGEGKTRPVLDDLPSHLLSRRSYDRHSTWKRKTTADPSSRFTSSLAETDPLRTRTAIHR